VQPKWRADLRVRREKGGLELGVQESIAKRLLAVPDFTIQPAVGVILAAVVGGNYGFWSNLVICTPRVCVVDDSAVLCNLMFRWYVESP
jgi:hypothetical protein